MKRYFERHIVTDGDLGFVTSGTPLYTEVVKGNKVKTYYNVAPKQLVMWVETKDGSIPTTIEPADITASNVNKLKIGVGFDPDGKGFATDIRLIGADKLQGCRIHKMNAAAPTCSIPEIKAIYPGCVSCEEFTVRIGVDDNKTRAFKKGPNTFEYFTSTYVPDCNTCDDCEVTVTCDEMVCGILDDLNNELDLEINGKLYPDWNGTGVDRPYRAVKLHDNWNAYCISPTGNDCKDCYQIDALTQFTVDGVAYDFVGVTDPTDDTKTLVSQLEYAGAQIEAKFEEMLGKHSGFVVVSKGIGECCPIQLHVVTCDPTFAITGLTPCDPAITQFPEFTEEGVCQECGTSPAVTTPSCGLAVIAKQDIQDCDCYLNAPDAYYGRHITVDIIGSESMAKYSKKATLQKGQLPSGFGAQVQWEEYEQLIGGQGRFYSMSNNYQGKFGLPDKTSRIRNAVTADCKKDYCLYWYQHGQEGNVLSAGNTMSMEWQLESSIWVPKGDDVTKAAVEAMNTAILAAKPDDCEVVTAITCDETATP